MVPKGKDIQWHKQNTSKNWPNLFNLKQSFFPYFFTNQLSIFFCKENLEIVFVSHFYFAFKIAQPSVHN